MPDHRLHRGPHPEDSTLFAPARWPTLQAAVGDLAWLLTHDYALPSALKLVGDHYQLHERQRLALMRSACSDASLALRRAHQIQPPDLAGEPLFLDGYNVLTTIEAALGHAVLLVGRDGCLRDMASLHGHYKRVLETHPALELIGQALAALGVSAAHWFLDQPVSNSGRLKTMLLQTAAAHGWPWTVELVLNPDPVLAKSLGIIATADSVILDAGPRWFNLTRHIVESHLPAARLVAMGG